MHVSQCADPTGPIRSIAIVGGGTAGWMSASLLARALSGTGAAITLIESAEIGVIGVGEATIPPFVDALRFLDIDLSDFIRHTEATEKLAIRFDGWNGPGTSYWHPFGTFGAGIGRRPFHHALLHARASGMGGSVSDFNLCAALAERDLALAPGAPLMGGARIALHLDSLLVARYLRQYAERLGVTRIEATVAAAERDRRGMIAAVTLADGRQQPADLFIDASGFSGVLIERVLGTGYIDWRQHLPCDRALALPTPRGPALPSYTTATAMRAGWRWCIPLQHRTGNGYVYSSDHVTDATAADEFLTALGGKQGADPRQLRFVPGRRRVAWVANCVAVGLASGFLEPLESTSIHGVVASIFNLLDHFPDRACDAALVSNYNREIAEELERIRDFLILHYALAARRDTPFWQTMAAAPLPESLAERIALYADAGTIRTAPRELFNEASWFYIFDGLGFTPRRSDPLIAAIDPGTLRGLLSRISREIKAGGARAVPHAKLFAR